MRSVRTETTDRRRASSGLADAVNLCKQRCVQLTATRQTLLEILWERPQLPLGAYPLMRQLEVLRGRPVTVTSVYRALDFLQQQGLITRIESRNGYLPCPNPGTPFEGVVFICDACGNVTGVNDPAIERLLTGWAESLEFRVRGKIVELQGVCRRRSKAR